MGVYIKGMEMPKSCPCKLVGVGYDMHCAFVSGVPSRVREYYECCENGTRPDWCRLGEVPPHGRLVDVDALTDNWYYASAALRPDDVKKVVCLDDIDNAPTIIEAEE